jgi:hypothetical protein
MNSDPLRKDVILYIFVTSSKTQHIKVRYKTHTPYLSSIKSQLAAKYRTTIPVHPRPMRSDKLEDTLWSIRKKLSNYNIFSDV